MKQSLIVISMICLLAGCKATAPITITETIREKVTETVRDTVVIVQPDASHIRALLECDEDRNVLVKELLDFHSGKHVKPPVIIVKDNILTATAEVDSFAIYLSWKERYHQTDTTRTVTLPPVTTNELTGLQWFQVWTGRIFIALIILCIIALIINRKFKIKN